jgi:hypothetical protein
MMGGVSIAAFLLLRHVRQRGMLGRAADVAIEMGVSHAVGGAGAAALRGARGLRSGRSSSSEPAPWERVGGLGDAAAVHGAPQHGFDPVPGGGGGAVFGAGVGESGSPGAATDERGCGGEGRGRQSAVVGTAEMTVGGDRVRHEGFSPRTSGNSGDPRRSAADGFEGGGVPGAGRDAGADDAAAPEVPPIVETDYGGPVPLPPEPLDDEPPPDDGEATFTGHF